MKVVLYMAMSPNGLIAREDGNEDFLSHLNWETFISLAKETGNFIYGRKTYESVLNWGNSYIENLDEIKTKIVVSKNLAEPPKNGFLVARSPEEALEILKKEGYSEALLTGGSTNNSIFAKKGLIDEIIINIEPKILGKGIPIFKDEDFEIKLKTKQIKQLDQGILQVHYIVEK